MKVGIKKTLFGFGIMTFAMCGAVVGNWTVRGQYPISEKQRIILTPQVKAGQPVEIAREVDRRDNNCDIKITGYVEYANGKRDPLNQRFEPGFGPLGYDGYIMEVPTSASAVDGEAYIWSKPGSACNPLEYWFNWWMPGQEKIDRFVIGEATIRIPLPAEFKIRKPAATTYGTSPKGPGPDTRRPPVADTW